MKYIMNLPEHILSEIRRLIEKNKYKDVASFLLTAAENQLFLEHEEEEVLDHGSAPKELPKESMDLLLFRDLADVEVINMPSQKQYLYPAVDQEEKLGPLWGQINRIFPMKVGLRVLASMLKTNGQYVELKDFQNQATLVARSYGLDLRREDKRRGRPRDSAHATGLPILDDEAKSRKRYQAHFLAYLREDDVIEGALGRLKFVNLKRNREGTGLIGITREGLEFASLKSPRLDNDTSQERTLSESEIEFYLKHVLHNIPGERKAIGQILKHISTGISTPGQLNDKFGDDYADHKWSYEVLSTNRSGLISRLRELGLVDRIRKGKEVTYAITQRGQAWTSLFLGS